VAAKSAEGASKVVARDRLAREGRLTTDVIALRIGGKLFDLMTPVPVDAPFDVIRETDAAGLDVIRHSSAHVMADAVQRLFPGTKVTIGPAVEDGFYYDFDRPEGAFSDEDLARIESEMRKIIAQDTPFRREVIGRKQAIDLFRNMGETYKVEIIERTPEDEELTLYRHGAPGHEWVDFCEGPHVPRTGKLAAIKLTSVAGAYWRGDERNPMLQRIYGTAFASARELEEHLKALEEAKKRDHRKLGKELDLFLFHEYAPAMPFFLPRGALVYTRLVDYLRGLYAEFGYEEVLTPQVFDKRLFETSGHWANYRENMYIVTTGERLAAIGGDGAKSRDELNHVRDVNEQIGLKPMNCPSHCLIFGSRRRSYRELPWRVADFGRLHRFERGGVVHGLNRVRSFCQDDAHIFCAPSSVQAEIQSFVDLLYRVYGALDMTDVSIKLATRPEKRMGTDAQWDEAERVLADALRQKGLAFDIAPGEGAFYGAKLEFHVRDALKRSWQLGTIQVDYTLPDRFELEFVGEDGKAHRPVMLHRAVLGSLERFLGVYIEHVGGAFPVWLAPEQACLLTVSEKQNAYAEEATAYLRGKGLRVVSDFGADKLGAKIRSARLMRYPYIAVIGDKEAMARSVSVRSHKEGELGAMPLAAFAERLLTEAIPPRLSPLRGLGNSPVSGAQLGGSVSTKDDHGATSI
jgi:threonyl-tRNA synthetase